MPAFAAWQAAERRRSCVRHGGSGEGGREGGGRGTPSRLGLRERVPVMRFMAATGPAFSRRAAQYLRKMLQKASDAALQKASK
jgi:hypothetical protein